MDPLLAERFRDEQRRRSIIWSRFRFINVTLSAKWVIHSHRILYVFRRAPSRVGSLAFSPNQGRTLKHMVGHVRQVVGENEKMKILLYSPDNGVTRNF